jgi:flagellar FliJ protein
MYRFRYETLLNHRRHEEERLQKALAEKKNLLDTARDQVVRLRRSKRESARRLQKVQRESRRVADIALHLDHLAKLSRELDRRKAQLVAAQKAFNAKRTELLEAVRRRKMLEKLKEKDLRAHELELRRRETKFLDQVGARQYLQDCPLSGVSGPLKKSEKPA